MKKDFGHFKMSNFEIWAEECSNFLDLVPFFPFYLGDVGKKYFLLKNYVGVLW